MVPMLAGPWSGTMHADLVPRWLQLVLATPVQFYVGRRFYVGAYHALRGGGANMDVLVVLSTSIAWLFSAAVTLLGLNEHVYFEASAAIITPVLLGKLLEARARAGTSVALEGLLRLQPRVACHITACTLSWGVVTTLWTAVLGLVASRSVNRKLRSVGEAQAQPTADGHASVGAPL
jgi:cation transport ATPase